MINLRQKAISGVMWSATQNWGSRLISFLVLTGLARLLGPKAFGLIALASTFTAFVQIFLDQGFSAAVIQRAELEPEHLDTAFWTGLLLGGLLTLISVMLSGLVALLFQEPELGPVVRWLSLSFILRALSSTQEAVLRRNLLFRSLAIRTLVATLVGGLVGIVLALLGFGVWSLVVQQLTSSFIGAIVLWRVTAWRPGLKFSRSHFSELFSFGINLVGSQFFNFFNRRADDFLIGYFLGPIPLGYYTIAYRLIYVMTQLLTGVTQTVAFSVFSRLQATPQKMREAFYLATHFTSVISFPTFVGIAVTAPELIEALYGSRWEASIPVMQILAFIGLYQSISYFNDEIIIAAGKPNWHMTLKLLQAITLIIAFLLAVRFGIAAIALAYVISGYLLAPVPIIMAKRLIGVEVTIYLQQIIIPLGGAVVMGVSLWLFKFYIGQGWSIYLQIAAYVCLGILTYFLFLQITAPALVHRTGELLQSVRVKTNVTQP